MRTRDHKPMQARFRTEKNGPTRREVLVGAGVAAALAAMPRPAGAGEAAAIQRPCVAVASANGLHAVRRAVERMDAGAAPVEARSTA